MIIMSFNCKGLGSSSKIPALIRLVELPNPNEVLIQGTMRVGTKIIGELSKCFKDWDFLFVDSVGRYGGGG
jgi:hypothetical protein